MVSIKDNPEVLDALIRDKYKSKPSTGGHGNSKQTAWTEDELEVMDCVVLSYIVESGCSKEQTAKELVNRWDVSLPSARRYVKAAIDRYYENYKTEDRDRQIKVWYARVEKILQDAMKTGCKDSALKSLEMLAKSYGIYNNKTDITLNGGDNPIQFDFN